VVEPRPWDRPVPYDPYKWPAGKRVKLLPRSEPLTVDFLQLLDQRETKRDFNCLISDKALGEFFWLACRNRSSRPSPFGVDQESRVHPSAGAMHPIHTLVARGSDPWLRYDPMSHVLSEIPGSEKAASTTRAKASELVAICQGTLLVLISEPGKTAAKYQYHETLVWRDAGVVLGYMSLAAQALGLSFCPLGITGEPYALDGWAEQDRLSAVGLAVLGASSQN
jgi:hypothetical protein